MVAIEPEGHNMNKLGRWLLYIAPYQISRLKALWINEMIFKYSLYKLREKLAPTPSGYGQPVKIVWTTLVEGPKGRAVPSYFKISPIAFDKIDLNSLAVMAIKVCYAIKKIGQFWKVIIQGSFCIILWIPPSSLGGDGFIANCWLVEGGRMTGRRRSTTTDITYLEPLA